MLKGQRGSGNQQGLDEARRPQQSQRARHGLDLILQVLWKHAMQVVWRRGLSLNEGQEKTAGG